MSGADQTANNAPRNDRWAMPPNAGHVTGGASAWGGVVPITWGIGTSPQSSGGASAWGGGGDAGWGSPTQQANGWNV